MKFGPSMVASPFPMRRKGCGVGQLEVTDSYAQRRLLARADEVIE
jgi:hypothetical protein